MWNPKGNEYGVKPKYEVGDTVRIWRIFKNPTGTIVALMDENAFPMKYKVRYQYLEEGEPYVEVFDDSELTLVERKYSGYLCNCGTGDDWKNTNHAKWCNKFMKRW